LSKDILYKGENSIFEIAKEQNFKSNIYGESFWDIEAFDSPEFVYNDDIKIKDIVIDENDFSSLSGNIPDCIKKLLLSKTPNWQERRCIILALRDNQYLFGEALNILKKYLSRKKFLHCFKSEKQIQHLYAKEKYLFPLQKELIDIGACSCKLGEYCSKAKHGCKLYGR